MTQESSLPINGNISYEDLRQIIKDFYLERYGIQLSTISIDYLKPQLMNNATIQPFFIMNHELGEKRFNISNEEIELILRDYFAKKNFDILDLSYGYKVNIKYKIGVDKAKVEETINNSEEVNDKSHIPFVAKYTYEDLRQMVFDVYKEKYGIDLQSISIDYLKSYLITDKPSQDFFIMKENDIESRFTIPKDDLIEMFKEYLKVKGCELTDIKFRDYIEFEYLSKNVRQVKEEQFASYQEKANEPVIHEEPVDLKNEEILVEAKNDKKVQLETSDELTRMAREHRKFTILQRERAMTEAQKAKNKASLMAGLCILGAAVTVYFNGQDANQVLQTQLDAIYSWEALVQYFKDLGPLTTLLSTGAAAFIAKYLKNSKKLKNAQNEFIDFNNSLEITESKEFGR